MSQPYIALEVGTLYRSSHSHYRVAQVKSRTTVELEELDAELLPAHEANTPTHHYLRSRLAQPIKVTGRTRATWTKTTGWGISRARGLVGFNRHLKRRYGIGEVLLDVMEEYESYSYCD
jgi:hypothetical protein